MGEQGYYYFPFILTEPIFATRLGLFQIKALCYGPGENYDKLLISILLLENKIIIVSFSQSQSNPFQQLGLQLAPHALVVKKNCWSFGRVCGAVQEQSLLVKYISS